MGVLPFLCLRCRGRACPCPRVVGVREFTAKGRRGHRPLHFRGSHVTERGHFLYQGQRV